MPAARHYEETVDRDGCGIHACASIIGDDAPWLVFSNSLMTDHTIWDGQVAHFGKRYNILRYDQRGHGRSGIGATVNFDVLSGDVEALFNRFGIERGIYVGLSMGVPTGLSFAGRNPGRLAAMVLVDGQSATQPGGSITWQARIDFARQNGMAAVADQTVERWFSKDFIAAGSAEQLRTAARQMQLDGYCACAAALQSYDFGQEAAALDMPVLLLAGANDGAMPQTMEAMKATIPDSHFQTVADAGHIPNVEQMERFNAALGAFLLRIRPKD